MDLPKKKILVTGASGFVGGALIKELKSAGNREVYGIVRKIEKFESELDPFMKTWAADISDYENLTPLLENLQGIDTVVHTAGLAHRFGATSKEDFRRINVGGTKNICRLAKNIGAAHLVLISSVAVYGDHGDCEIDESFECRPEGAYGESKLASEQAARELCEKNDLRLTILRPATIIGEGDPGNTSRLITIIDKKRFFWVGKGANKKSLIYKGDVARAILKTIEKSTAECPAAYNLTATAISMSEIVGVISQTLQTKTPRFGVPESMARGCLRMGESLKVGRRLGTLQKNLEKWLSDDVFSGRKFSEAFDFEPETSIREALARQVEFYMEQRDKR